MIRNKYEQWASRTELLIERDQEEQISKKSMKFILSKYNEVH